MNRIYNRCKLFFGVALTVMAILNSCSNDDIMSVKPTKLQEEVKAINDISITDLYWEVTGLGTKAHVTM